MSDEPRTGGSCEIGGLRRRTRVGNNFCDREVTRTRPVATCVLLLVAGRRVGYSFSRPNGPRPFARRSLPKTHEIDRRIVRRHYVWPYRTQNRSP